VADPSKDLINVANHLRIACSAVDSTTLNYGRSCNEIRAKKKKKKTSHMHSTIIISSRCKMHKAVDDVLKSKQL
jgi:hypothetical protein